MSLWRNIEDVADVARIRRMPSRNRLQKKNDSMWTALNKNPPDRYLYSAVDPFCNADITLDLEDIIIRDKVK